MRELDGKLVVVVGMAKSGHAAVRLLLSQGARVRAVDQGAEKAPGEVLGLTIQPQTPAAFEDADLIVISPGVPADLPLFPAGVPVIGELELAAPFLQGPVMGITGTNGKTTTTALTAHILKEAGIPAQAGGNIGIAPADMIQTSRPDQWNVLELSSFQLETISTFRAQVAACLNITQNHLDRHHNFENYVKAKARLFETQHPGDTAVLNAGDAVCAVLATYAKGDVLWFNSEAGAWLDGNIMNVHSEPLLDVRELRLRGRHNYENVMAAAMLARIAGATLPQIAAAAKTFAPVEHRLEFVANVDGVAYYNDSKATSVDATLKAIQAFEGGLWVILGGKDKDSDFRPLREPLHERARAVLLIGSAAGKLHNQLAGAVNRRQCGTLAAAVGEAYIDAKPGDTVLLAPACASFDQFTSYEHRGHVFKQLVQELAKDGSKTKD
jgi:UDP-N-acetylmuramoylalanine--D-glutamate ligase